MSLWPDKTLGEGRARKENMRTENEMMVSVGGVILAFFELLRKKLEKVGLGFEAIRFLVTPQGEETMDKIVELLVGKVSVMVGSLKRLAFARKVDKTERAKTADCLKIGTDHIVYRDSNIGLWLGEFTPAVGGGLAAPFELTMQNGTQFREMVADITGQSGTDEERQKFMVAQEKTFSPKQVEQLLGAARKVEGRTDCPVTGLLTNGCANILFVHKENEDGSVSVFALYVYWDGDGWCVEVFSFGSDSGWCAGCRVFFRK